MNVYVYKAPVFSGPLVKRLAVSEVTVSVFLSAFDQVTVDPTLTVRVSGLNPFAVMLILSGAGGVCVALTCFVDVFVSVPLGVFGGFNKLLKPRCKLQADRREAEIKRRAIKVKRFILPPCNGGNPTLELLIFAVTT